MTALLLAVLIAAQEQPVVTAALTPSEVRVGEPAVLRITVQSNDGGRPRIVMPRLPLMLEVVSTRDFSQTSISSSGRVSTVTQEFVLVAGEPGRYRIPPAPVTAGRTTLQTPELFLVVTGDTVTRDRAPAAGARLLVYMNRDTVFVGQQVTLVGEVLLLPELQMRLTRPPIYEAPAPTEFWMQELPSEPGTQVRNIDGERYIGQRFFRAYFPLSPGRYQFAPARVSYEARQGFLLAPQVFDLRSNSARIVVLPVPENDKPESFDGAVGNFTVRAWVEPVSLNAGDAATLNFEIAGNGNIKALPPPRIPSIAGIDLLDPAETADVTNREQIVRGTKRFSWVFVPERAGDVLIPPIEYASFDPIARRYHVSVTDSIRLPVNPAGSPTLARAGGLRTSPSPFHFGFVRSPGFSAMQLVPFAFIIAAIVSRRRRALLPGRIYRNWKHRQLQLRAQPNPFGAAEQLLRDALFTLSPQPQMRSGSADEVKRLLATTPAAQFADRVATLLARLEAIRYSSQPPERAERDAILDELNAVLAILWRVARAQPRVPVTPLLLLFSLQTAPAELFERGADAFEQGRSAQAAQLFQQYVSAQPADASGWYNRGLAERAQRKPALAAWAFLKAAQLEPRATDIDAQLERSGVVRMGQRVRPLTRLTTEELLLAASLLWWITAICIALWIARGRRTFAFVALVAAALAGIGLGSWAIERALPPPAIVLDDGAPLLAANNRHADLIRHLQPLAGVTVLEEREGWVHVRTSEGERGWIEVARLGRL